MKINEQVYTVALSQNTFKIHRVFVVVLQTYETYKTVTAVRTDSLRVFIKNIF